MTTQEIHEANQLIALMRADLSLIAGTADVDRLVALVLHKVSRMMTGLRRLVSGPDYDWCCSPLMIMLAFAQMVELNSAYDKKRLVDAVAKQVPLMNANLDKIAQTLREKRQ